MEVLNLHLFFLLMSYFGQLKEFLNKIYVCECFACMYICTKHAFSVWRGEKTVSDLLALELHKDVNHHVGIGNQTPFLWKGSHFS